MPLALACTLCLTFLLLQAYRLVLHRRGARFALRASGIGVACVLVGSSYYLWTGGQYGRSALIFFSFALRMSYVTFLSSQQFSFIVSLLKTNSNREAGPHGITSVVSSFGAFAASKVTEPPLAILTGHSQYFLPPSCQTGHALALADPRLEASLRGRQQGKKSDEDTPDEEGGVPPPNSLNSSNQRGIFACMPRVFKGRKASNAVLCYTGNANDVTTRYLPVDAA